MFVDYIPWISSLATPILRDVETKTFNTLRRELARQLKTARQKANLSQEALALEAEVDRTYVSQLERGVANPSLQVLHRLSHTLGLEMKITLVLLQKENRSADAGELP